MSALGDDHPVALVTGSALGIGRAIVEALRDAGYVVYASMRGVEGRNAEAAQSLKAQGENRVHRIEMDVLSEESCQAAVEQLCHASGRLDVVVNNAGMLMNGMAESFTPSQFLSILDTNAVSWLRVNRAVLRAQGRGTIVYVGSTTTYVPEPFIGLYQASKAAGDALARAMALEIRPFGIESLFLVPGAFPEGTDHFADAQSGDDPERTISYGALTDRLPALTGRIETIDREEGLELAVRSVGEQLAQALEKPVGERPSPPMCLSIGQAKGADAIAEVVGQVQSRFIERLGFGDLLPAFKTISR
ncbi:SDR family NAD(P)-dependent oxidoreductase [Sinorhizobium medicae]|uniref:SDR family NAD(P)-dependent oxidoreductase n=1 Tax=Sinorhizobium medicae TaxID=110321 RepID=UPI0011A3DBEA|nr:SDR family NAD(P)-dependent oxidoreductase [Sinorhizobium medicae]MDX0469326.1 SDR family NAD(P)-dependent oxidoreductase [Sinorhizobium medicae]MDX1176462.1 SDR family NAD(P)-dependent oxidoreductase [Sinorhizobium medicae]MDX1201161.1 SDR family NAD(P)-dependent oxidoreductase [Sinorhizobium medicae]MDX1225539.1 SDR family NAD(P)-dependent oxidoreductase [Sinorhizobium medicae]MDX1250068.1 SDR family NAD(P)-dependent oxidoreductase [Sinorhizobium medicae]